VPQSVTAFFTEPDEFAAALANESGRHLVITGHGRFRARLTWIALYSSRLLAGEESLSRIAFLTVPSHMTPVVLQCGPHPAPILGGIVMESVPKMHIGATRVSANVPQEL
jgi:hypothetical protein